VNQPEAPAFRIIEEFITTIKPKNVRPQIRARCQHALTPLRRQNETAIVATLAIFIDHHAPIEDRWGSIERSRAFLDEYVWSVCEVCIDVRTGDLVGITARLFVFEKAPFAFSTRTESNDYAVNVRLATCFTLPSEGPMCESDIDVEPRVQRFPKDSNLLAL
jgi:hypothetical protein